MLGTKLILFSYRKLCWWSLCTTTQKYGNQLINMLPTFIDEVLLHPGEQDPVFRAATQAFAFPGVLDHTAIVIFHRDKLGNELGEQLALSTPFLPWGLHLPRCEDCSTTTWVGCKSRAGPVAGVTEVKICCFACNREGVVYLPRNAKVLQQDILDEKVYMRLAYPPARRVEWKKDKGRGVPQTGMKPKT
jgi:hypothetical protein